MAHRKAPPLTFARHLRRHSTPSESILWSRLRRHGLGVHFRRQHPFAGFILDFVCLSHKLVVEVDGTSHSEVRDTARDAFLARSGFRIVHVKAWMVERHISVVLDVIRAAL